MEYYDLRFLFLLEFSLVPLLNLLGIAVALAWPFVVTSTVILHALPGNG